MLAFIGGLHRTDRLWFPRRIRIGLLAIFLLSLLCSLGQSFAVSAWLFRVISTLLLSRYPSRILVAGIFPIALLAGYGAEVFSRQIAPQIARDALYPSQKRQKVISLILLWGIAGLLLLFTCAFFFSKTFSDAFQQFFFQQSGSEIACRGLTKSFAHTTAIWWLLTLFYQYQWWKPARKQQWILAGIVLVDLLVVGKDVNVLTVKEFFTTPSFAVSSIVKNIGDGRLYQKVSKKAYQYPSRVPSYDIQWLYRWHIEMLFPYIPVFYRIPTIFQEDLVGLTSAYTEKLYSIIEALPWADRLPLLSAGAVSLIFTTDLLSIPGIRLIEKFDNWAGIPFYLYQNEHAGKRVEFVTDWAFAASDNETLAMMRQPAYDARKFVVLQETLPTLFEWTGSNKNSIPGSSRNLSYQEPTQIDTIKSTDNSVLLYIRNSSDGILVFSESFYPGWQVYVDGKSTPVFRANYQFFAIFLKQGMHEVYRVYRPHSVLSGLLVTLFCGCFLAFIIYTGWGISLK